MGIGHEIMIVSDIVHELCGQMCENDLWPWHFTLRVKFKVIQTMTIWKTIGNNIGVGLEIMSLSNLIPELQSQMCEKAQISNEKWPQLG